MFRDMRSEIPELARYETQRALNLDGLEQMLDGVMEELLKLEATDPSISGTLPDGDIEFSLAVEAETLEEALLSAFGTIRTAIHAAEGATAGWPEFRAKASPRSSPTPSFLPNRLESTWLGPAGSAAELVGRSAVGSNPSASADVGGGSGCGRVGSARTVLGGELAVPCTRNPL